MCYSSHNELLIPLKLMLSLLPPTLTDVPGVVFFLPLCPGNSYRSFSLNITFSRKYSTTTSREGQVTKEETNSKAGSFMEEGVISRNTDNDSFLHSFIEEIFTKQPL